MSPAVLVQRGAAGGGTVDPSLVGGRLSLLAGTPAPTLDLIGITTLRWVPVADGRTALWNGSAVEMFTETADVALALTGLTTGRLSDVFLWPNAPTTRALELSAWAGHGQAITGATNATPIVITATAHGLANGDEVYIEGVRSTATDDYPQVAPNGTWIVASVTANTFALTGSVGSFTYFRGGYFSARSAANRLTMQNGMLCRLGAPTRRHVGTIRATGATSTEDSRAKRFVWNAHNQVARALLRFDYGQHTIQNVPADNPSIPTVGYRLWNSGSASRVEFIQGLIGQPLDLSLRYGLFGAAGSHLACQPGLDGTPRRELMTSSHQPPTANQYLTGAMAMRVPVQNGYHFADIMESEVLNFQVTVFQGIVHGAVWA